jgi:hypothetical protein
VARQRPLLYGWYDGKRGCFMVSRLPADAPVRPAWALSSRAEVTALLERKRADIMWWPPLPGDVASSDAA